MAVTRTRNKKLGPITLDALRRILSSWQAPLRTPETPTHEKHVQKKRKAESQPSSCEGGRGWGWCSPAG